MENNYIFSQDKKKIPFTWYYNIDNQNGHKFEYYYHHSN